MPQKWLLFLLKTNWMNCACKFAHCCACEKSSLLMNERLFFLLLCPTSVRLLSSPILSTCRMHTRYSIHTFHQIIIIDMSPHYSNAVLCYWHLYSIIFFLLPIPWAFFFCQSKNWMVRNECIVAMVHILKSFSKPLYLCIGLVSCDNADSVSPVTPPYTHSGVENILKWINCKSSFLRVHLFDRENKTEQKFLTLFSCSGWWINRLHDYTQWRTRKKVYWIPFDYLIFVVVL